MSPVKALTTTGPVGLAWVPEIGSFRQGRGSALWALTKASIQAATASGTGVRPSSQRVTWSLGQSSSCARSAASHRNLLRHSRRRPAIMATRFPVQSSNPLSMQLWTAGRCSLWTRRRARFIQLRGDASVADTCCAARNISVEATVRRFHPADSAASSRPASSGLSALRHSAS